MSRVWSAPELDVLDALTRRVRLMTIRQVSDIWWPQCAAQSETSRQLKRLRQASLIQRSVIVAHPRLAPRRPVVSWEPGGPTPDLAAATHRIRLRWNQTPEPIEVYWASEQAANLFGSAARSMAGPCHRDHELLLSDVFVFYRMREPQLARRWGGESIFPKAGFRIKDPDAFLFDDDGNVCRVIESAGRYGLAQVRTFHRHCVENQLPYELW